MTINQWRADKDCLRRASKVLENPELKKMLELLRDDSQSGYPTNLVNSNEHNHSYELGFIKGERAMMDRLKSLAVQVEKQKPIKQNYQP